MGRYVDEWKLTIINFMFLADLIDLCYHVRVRISIKCDDMGKGCLYEQL